MKKNAIVITNGCPENRLDCAETEQLLVQNGWEITSKVGQADIIVLNLCGLLNEYEEHSLALIQMANKKKKKKTRLLVTGCLPKINPACIKQNYKGDIVKGHNLKKLADVLKCKDSSNGASANYLIEKDGLTTTAISKFRRKIQNGLDLNSTLHRSQYIEYQNYFNRINLVQPNTFYIKVSSGCIHACSYCAVKNSRGSVKSKPIDEIKSEFLRGLAAGFSQFALIGTDLGSYGKDIHSDLTVLLRELVSIDGEFNIKLRNVHPQLLIKKLSELEDIVKTGKIAHITTAIQHGNDRILNLMKRAYNIRECKYAITRLKNACPDLTIRAQLIVGFPGETNLEFNDTLNLIDECHAAFFEVYPYSQRLGTLAAKMPNQVSRKIIYQRKYIAVKRVLNKINHKVMTENIQGCNYNLLPN